MNLTTNSKPSRKEAFNLLLDARKSDETLTITQMDELINHFAPPVPKSPKTVEQWVARVAQDNQKDVRPYLHYCHVKDRELVATDGHRMHIAKNRDLLDGFYDPKTMLFMKEQSTCGAFPDYKRVAPNFSESDLKPFDVKDWATATIKSGLFCYVIDGQHFDKSYVDAAIGAPEKQEYGVIGPSLVFQSENTFSVTLPIHKNHV